MSVARGDSGAYYCLFFYARLRLSNQGFFGGIAKRRDS